MPSDPKIRASDADRDRTAALLREHHAAGRLTLDEFNERLDKAYAAKTTGELDVLLADLPAIDLYKLPDASLRPGQPNSSPLPWRRPPGTLMAAGGRFSPAWRAAWGSWLSITSICLVIWLLAGASLANPWFLWLIGPWGILMLGRWLTGAPSHHGHGRGMPPGGGEPGSGPPPAADPGQDRRYGRGRYGQSPGGQSRYGQSPYGQSPHGRGPGGRDRPRDRHRNRPRRRW
jgi:hypothetical protein